jgi:hypothetical protein
VQRGGSPITAIPVSPPPRLNSDDELGKKNFSHVTESMAHSYLYIQMLNIYILW